MNKKKFNSDEMKLQPVSNEEVRQILNGSPMGAAYGCGSGSGSGDGRKYQKVSGSKVMNLKQEIS